MEHTTAVQATFKKSERLTSKTVMDEIFEKGRTIKKFPFILKYLPITFDDNEPLKIVITVPKRKINKANKRNRVRRQIKEVYRLNKASLKQKLKKENQSLALFLIYTGKENPDYNVIEEKIKLILNELTDNYFEPPLTGVE